MLSVKEFIHVLTSTKDPAEIIESVGRLKRFLTDDLFAVYDMFEKGYNSSETPTKQTLLDEFNEVETTEVDPADLKNFLAELKVKELTSKLVLAESRYERREIMEKILLLESSSKSSEEIQIVKSSELNLSSCLLEENDGIVYPSSILNSEVGTALPGWAVVVAGATSMGKTTFVNSIAIVNSVQGTKKLVYIYSEAMVRDYQAGLWSAFSQTISGMSRESGAFKRVTTTDTKSIEFIDKFFEIYRNSIKGDITFVYAGDLDSDPVVLDAQVRKILRDEGADYFIVDTLSRMGSSPSSGYKDVNIYTKHITTVFTDICVSEGVTGFLLCQLTSEGEKSAQRKLSVRDSDILGRDVTKDASQTFAILSTPEMRQAGRCLLQCLKNRHGFVPVDSMTLSASFGHSWIGDPLSKDSDFSAKTHFEESYDNFDGDKFDGVDLSNF